jgi:hypothetical protein
MNNANKNERSFGTKPQKLIGINERDGITYIRGAPFYFFLIKKLRMFKEQNGRQLRIIFLE